MITLDRSWRNVVYLFGDGRGYQEDCSRRICQEKPSFDLIVDGTVLRPFDRNRRPDFLGTRNGKGCAWLVNNRSKRVLLDVSCICKSGPPEIHSPALAGLSMASRPNLEVRQCKSMDFTVGILRRDWLKDANFTGDAWGASEVDAGRRPHLPGGQIQTRILVRLLVAQSTKARESFLRRWPLDHSCIASPMDTITHAMWNTECPLKAPPMPFVIRSVCEVDCAGGR